jgi:PAS domain S-box-containing protein
VAYFICPNCKDRSIDHDRREGLTQQAVSCHRCGFGFLFELLEDYYPAPNTGFVVCDRNARILACGRDVFELSGFREQELMGRDVIEALGISGFDGKNPAKIALEWGVRRMDQKLEMRSRVGSVKPVTADFFPAYDEDGGLLVGITPR